jgi:hypothetical protein
VAAIYVSSLSIETANTEISERSTGKPMALAQRQDDNSRGDIGV